MVLGKKNITEGDWKRGNARKEKGKEDRKIYGKGRKEKGREGKERDGKATIGKGWEEKGRERKHGERKARVGMGRERKGLKVRGFKLCYKLIFHGLPRTQHTHKKT